jgi:hypothetical protein
MPQVIKFRAWDKTNKKMVNHQYLECHRSGFRLLNSGEFEFMQYTGLQDEDGKEVYDKDIIQTPMPDHLKPDYGEYATLLVELDLPYLYVSFPSANPHRMTWDEFGVPCFWKIGNIYQNPELLTEAKYRWPL